MAQAKNDEPVDDFKLYGSVAAVLEAAAVMEAEENNILSDVNMQKKSHAELPVESDPPQYRTSYSSTMSPEVLAILVNHRILHPNGKPVMTEPEKKGRGPLLDIDAWQRMLAADSTPDHRWTEWIFDQAAGGKDAKEKSARAIEQIYRQFIDERISGFKHADTGKWHEPVNREEAEKRWTQRRPFTKRPDVLQPSPEMRFKRMFFQADEELADRLKCYGFFRSWTPRYENIVKAVAKFLSLEELAVKLNKLIEGGKGLGEDTVSFNPKHYPDAEALNAANKRIERFFAAQHAAKDVRVASDKYVYSDDFVSIIVPLTYAAAVRYGWQEWAWANKENFEKMLMGRGTNTDYWRQHTKDNIIAILRFKKPMPGWVTRARNEFKTPTLTNLAVFMPIAELKSLSIRDDLQFWDEENKQNLNYDDIAKIIKSEPDKPDNSEQDEMLPIKSWKVYKTSAEADKALEHFNHALTELVKWASQFDSKKVKSDTLTLDAAPTIKGRVQPGQPA